MKNSSADPWVWEVQFDNKLHLRRNRVSSFSIIFNQAQLYPQFLIACSILWPSPFCLHIAVFGFDAWVLHLYSFALQMWVLDSKQVARQIVCCWSSHQITQPDYMIDHLHLYYTFGSHAPQSMEFCYLIFFERCFRNIRHQWFCLRRMNFLNIPGLLLFSWLAKHWLQPHLFQCQDSLK